MQTRGAGDEYGDEDKSANIWSEGLEMVSEEGGGAGLVCVCGGGAAESVANRRRLGPCSSVHISAVQMLTRLTAHKMHANVCWCCWVFFLHCYM